MQQIRRGPMSPYALHKMIQKFETTGQLGIVPDRRGKHIPSSSIENVAIAVVKLALSLRIVVWVNSRHFGARALYQNKLLVVLKTYAVAPRNAIIIIRQKTGTTRRLNSNISETDISRRFIDLPILVLDGEIGHPSNQRLQSIVRPFSHRMDGFIFHAVYYNDDDFQADTIK
ncbi:hypothetical protein TNCV_2312781 [Trichonephila clavipes]|nr:hypothetical protein TNCV_2312781 [Trichonephila clavipes]